MDPIPAVTHEDSSVVTFSSYAERLEVGQQCDLLLTPRWEIWVLTPDLLIIIRKVMSPL